MKTLNISTFIAFITIMFFSCTTNSGESKNIRISKKSRVNVDSNKTNSVKYLSNNVEIKTDTTILSSGFNKIILLSDYVVDSLNESESIYFFPLILNQKINLFYQNKLIYSKNHAVKKIEVKDKHNKKIKILENVIYQIGIIEGQKESFFCIEGYGGCSSCTEYSEIINKNGNTIFLLFYDEKKVYQSKGNLINVLSENGIDQKKYRSGNYKKLSTSPKL